MGIIIAQSPKDYEIDQNVGFTIIEAHEIDDIGMSGIIEKVRSTVGDTPTYLSIDIDGEITPLSICSLSETNSFEQSSIQALLLRPELLNQAVGLLVS